MNPIERIEKLEKELAELKAEILQSESASGLWIPGKDEDFWYLDCAGSTVQLRNSGPFQHLSGKLFILGNYFRTKDEAEFVSERLKVLAEMRKYAKGFKPDWHDLKQVKFGLYRTGTTSPCKIHVEAYTFINHGDPVYFASAEDAAVCIDGIGNERLLKYYFMEGVESV